MLSEVEKGIRDFYEGLWQDPGKINRNDQDVLLGWHYGFYEKGIKTISEAMSNMNRYVGRLLDLGHEDNAHVFDAGSGVGATSLFLAKIYPDIFFHGITLTENELKIAESLREQHLVSNVEFKQGSYMNSGFPDNYFSRIFALESAAYSTNKNDFLKEMYRLLKHDGKLVIIDTFAKKYTVNSLLTNVDNYILKRNQSVDDLANYCVNIDELNSILRSLNFKGITCINLVSSGNVKKSHIYGFLIYRLFPYLSLNLKKSDGKSNLLKNQLLFPLLFLIFFIYKLLLIFYSKPGYYSIEAMK
jgi:ubiquinone/menaquinone biosynthesis C-methylase UbiE